MLVNIQVRKSLKLHDYCYAKALYSKFKSDCIFLEGMAVLKVKPWKRNAMFYAVLFFGWWGWYKHRWKIKI